jgi:hypothetical protein
MWVEVVFVFTKMSRGCVSCETIELQKMIGIENLAWIGGDIA